MRAFTIILGSAVLGAVLAIAAVFTLNQQGYMPLNEGQLRAYLVGHPQLVADMSDALQRQQDTASAAASADAMKKIGLDAFFDTKIAFVTGPADAKKSFVEFYDYDCPYCRASLPAIEKYYRQHKDDTRFSFIEFPIPSLHGPGATLAALASLAARNQPDKYVAFHFLLMGESEQINDQIVLADARKAGLDVDKLKADMGRPEIAAALAASHDLAHRAGIDGTPTFIANGVPHPGAVDEATLAEIMNG